MADARFIREGKNTFLADHARLFWHVVGSVGVRSSDGTLF